MTPERVIYHFNAPLARVIGWRKPRHVNFAVTLGRHCFVRYGFISGRHRAHEFYHSLRADEEGFGRWLLRYFWRLLRYGYRRHPEEQAAELFASRTAAEFADVGRARHA